MKETQVSPTQSLSSSLMKSSKSSGLLIQKMLPRSCSIFWVGGTQTWLFPASSSSIATTRLFGTFNVLVCFLIVGWTYPRVKETENSSSSSTRNRRILLQIFITGFIIVCELSWIIRPPSISRIIVPNHHWPRTAIRDRTYYECWNLKLDIYR